MRYLADIATLEKGTVKPLNASLRDLAGDCGGASIDVVTYGAGVRAVINAIKLDAAVSPSFKLNNLIAIVPDIDADALDDAFVRTIGQYARRTTFYVSATDPALIESKRRRTRTAADARGSAAPVLRVGDAAQRVWTATGVDVVDVSGFDASLGNPLSRDDASVVADLYQVLEGLEPSSRRYLRRVETPTASYWQLSR